MFGLPIIDIVAIAVYFAVVVAIGIWASRHIKSQEDFFLGGRRFGKFVQTFAAFGQATSSDNAVGLSVLVSRNGVAGIWQSITQVFALPIYWITSVWYRRLRLLTLGDFFEERYKSKGIASFYAIVSSIFFMIVIALGFTALTKTVSAITEKPKTEWTQQEQLEFQHAQEFDSLKTITPELLTVAQESRITELRRENPRQHFSYLNETIMLWAVALIVILYSVAGGLEAAFLTDTLQGIFILILSCLLLPFAGMKINATFGGSGLPGIIEAAKSRLSAENFELWGSPAMVDFTWYFILVLLIMSQINVGVQANQLVASGSAKDEYTARWGFTTGIFIKRWATLLWGITALLLVVLYQSTVENPDYLWGYACRDLLGPFNLGLVGLMIACLMAALMSTADALMITASSLLTHNFLRTIRPNMPETSYVTAGRLFGCVVVLGGAFIATFFDNVMQIMKLLWEFNIVLAASFWLGMKWRRANRAGAWASMLATLIIFGLIPALAPMVPGMRANPRLLKTVDSINISRTYVARDIDVEKREAEIVRWENSPDPKKQQSTQPLPLTAGENFTKSYQTPRESIFWTHGLKLDAEGNPYGAGRLNPELMLLDLVGLDLAKNPYALNESIRMSIRTVFPFLILIIVSLCTKPQDKESLDRFYVKMKTPVHDDKEQDLREMELSYQNPDRFDYRKLFPDSNWEFDRFTKTDIKGIAFFSGGAVTIFLALYAVALLGR